MLPSFQMSVPADARYRVLAPEAAAKFAVLAGCGADEAHAFQADVERAATGLAVPHNDIALVFSVADGAVTATLSNGATSATVRRQLPPDQKPS